jgi:hypothetical protein
LSVKRTKLTAEEEATHSVVNEAVHQLLDFVNTDISQNTPSDGERQLAPNPNANVQRDIV